MRFLLRETTHPHPSSATDLFLTFISLEGNTGEPAKPPEGPASRSSVASSRRFQIAEGMGFKGDFRQWENLLGLEIDYGSHSRSNLVAGDRGGTTQCRPTGQVVPDLNYRHVLREIRLRVAMSLSSSRQSGERLID